MTNPLLQIKDRRKPWQKELKNFPVARCGAMLRESAAAHGKANNAAARDLNKADYLRDGSRRPSVREMQYYMTMTTGDARHHSAGHCDFEKIKDAAAWLAARGLA